MTDSHDPLRDLIHQSLVSDKLTPSAELQAELEQRLASPESSDEVVVSPAKREPEKKPRRRIVRAWHMALVVTAVLAVMVYLSLPERWQRTMSQVNDIDLRGGSSLQTRLDGSGVTRGVEEKKSLPAGYYQFDDVQHFPASDGESEGLSALPDYLIGNTGDRNKQLGEGVLREQGQGIEGYVETPQIELDPAVGEPTANASAELQDIGAKPSIGMGLSGRGAAAKGKFSVEVGSGSKGPGANSGYGNRSVRGIAVDPKGVRVHSVETTRESFASEAERQAQLATFAQSESRTADFLAKQPQRQQLAQAETEKLLKLTSDLRSKQGQLGPKHPEVLKLTEEINHVAQYVEKLHAALAIDNAPGTEQYDAIHDNPFLPAKDAPLSTFSIDVDTASYANVRRFLTQGQVPPADAVRIEELLNYFSYDYPAPKPDEPFSVNMETAPCPWQPDHLLLRVGLKGKEVHKAERPASNLVFLIDTSGSMSDEDKLPLVKQAMSMLTRELGERDRITIVTYAGEAGLKLAPTNGGDHGTITSVINSLNSNGSTHGSAGIQLAYEKARESFIKEGTNRVILCTDGDLNVGVTQDDQLVDLITKEAKTGVFLTVLGFGQGNLKDSKMEKLADHGNGVYAYIDGVREAKKVLVDQLSGSLTTIAKDVKIQIEFNPGQVRAYRLIGYENRVLAAKDFNDDTKDAGEIGAGHTVTALYELAPAGVAEPKPVLDDLKYQGGKRAEGKGQREKELKDLTADDEASKELLTLKLRFKQPDGEESKKIEYPLSEKGTRFNNATPDFRFAASVAAFGMILRDSPHRGGITMAGVGEIAASSLGDDTRGYRAEFLDLVRRAEKLGKR
jgi:Ca-activated chloride channel family protein